MKPSIETKNAVWQKKPPKAKGDRKPQAQEILNLKRLCVHRLDVNCSSVWLTICITRGRSPSGAC